MNVPAGNGCRSAPGFWKTSRLSEPGLRFTLGRGALGFVELNLSMKRNEKSFESEMTPDKSLNESLLQTAAQRAIPEALENCLNEHRLT